MFSLLFISVIQQPVHYHGTRLTLSKQYINSLNSNSKSMRGSRRGSNFDNVFLVDAEGEDAKTTINGPLSARQRNAIRWRFAGVPMMDQH